VRPVPVAAVPAAAGRDAAPGFRAPRRAGTPQAAKASRGAARPEPVRHTGPARPVEGVYWYRDSKGRLAPWPPQRTTWGRLRYRDMPDGSERTAANRAYAGAHWARVREARRAAAAEIEADPQAAAARFARYSSACCCRGGLAA